MTDHSSHPASMVTICPNPDGGYTPVVHASAVPAPQPHPDDFSLPTAAEAVQYARNHYGTLTIVIDDHHTAA